MYILLIVFSAFIAFEVLKRILAKGNIESEYIITDKENNYLLLLLDYETSMMGKGGVSVFHNFKLKRINLEDLSVEYEAKVRRFSTGMLEGSARIFGINENFIFIFVDNFDLVIINNKEGRRQCNKKAIIAVNPHLKDFKIELCKYSHILQSVVIYSNEGNAYVLDPETLKTEMINFNISPDDKVTEPLNFSNLPGVNLSDQYLSVREPNPYIAASGEFDVEFIEKEGTKRFFIHIKHNFSEEKPKDLSESFLNPKIMNTGICRFPYLSKNPFSVVIVHSKTLNPGLSDIMVSKVSKGSKEIWKQGLTNIVYRPKLSGQTYLYYAIIKNKIYFFCKRSSDYKLSISVVDKTKGDILMKPKLLVNRNCKR